jgi:hypothetical protein
MAGARLERDIAHIKEKNMIHDEVDGKIRRLFVNEAGCNMWLDQQGEERYFRLKLTHKNYNSSYALILAATSNHWKILLRLRDYKPLNNPSDEIQYKVVDYPQ